VGDRAISRALSPVFAGSNFAWGLRPRLYAVACFAGLTPQTLPSQAFELMRRFLLLCLSVPWSYSAAG
jgi:hypothetical protein